MRNIIHRAKLDVLSQPDTFHRAIALGRFVSGATLAIVGEIDFAVSVAVRSAAPAPRTSESPGFEQMDGKLVRFHSPSS